jgi:putative Mg2+ transporter-C (MgtC) family protein
LFQDFLNPAHWQDAGQVLLRAGLAVILGGMIGWEREMHGKPSGVRTHMLVALGATLFTECGRAIGGDPARIAAQVVTGVGFLGAGTIMRMGIEVRGLTTAASVWATAAIAMAVAVGGSFMIVATLGTVLVLVTLALVDDLVRRFIRDPMKRHLEVVLDDRSAVHDLLEALTRSQLSVLSVQVQSAESEVTLTLQVEGRESDVLETLCILPHVKSAQWAD